jgi:hypothetical protein
MTHKATDVVLAFDVTLNTRSLSLNQLPDGRIERHQLIEQLHEEGLLDKEIANFLNLAGITTPSGLPYYSELVFMTRRKMRLRSERQQERKISIGKLSFYLNTKTEH